MKKLVSIFIISIILIQINILVYAESININANSYILLDSKSGQVLYEKNPNERVYPASTTKVMTAILAIEKGDMNQIMTASQAAVNDIGVDGMNIGIMAGEELRLEDLLNAMLIKSANETANIIAENLAPTRKDFIDMMNKKAQELGATGTNFVNPCGAHHPNHYSTASDMSKIARYAMSLPKFREIVNKDSYKMPPTNKHPKPDWGSLYTTNKLLKTKSNYFTSITGIKTGYTSQAGNNLLSSAVNDDGVELISILLDLKTPGADKNIFNYSKEILEYGFRNYSLQSIVDANQNIATVQVDNSENDASLDLLTADSLRSVLPVDKSSWNLIKKEYVSTAATAPVTQGDVMGYIEYERNGVSLGKVNIIASQSVAQKKITAKTVDKAKQAIGHPVLKKVITGCIIVLLSFALLRVILRRISRIVHAKGQENE